MDYVINMRDNHRVASLNNKMHIGLKGRQDDVHFSHGMLSGLLAVHTAWKCTQHYTHVINLRGVHLCSCLLCGDVRCHFSHFMALQGEMRGH